MSSKVIQKPEDRDSRPTTHDSQLTQSAGPKSIKLFEKAQRVLVGGVNSPVRAFKAVGGTPLFIQKAKGSQIQDVDRRWYTDLCLSWGPLILGHAHPRVVMAAQKALREGSTFGAPNPREFFLAQMISEALPSMQRMRFTNSGTEAVMSALRLVRACTGRNKVIKFAGCYHGHVDALLIKAGSGATTLGIPDSAGVPLAWTQETLSVPYNCPEAVEEAFARWGKEIGGVIVEPATANMGVVLPKPGFLKFLREITSRYKALLIFDEVVTGFRLEYGGAQTAFGIEPDMTCLGKIIGGGFPMGAYGGRKEIMENVAPLGPVYQAGTLSGNPVAMAAGIETLSLLKNKNPYAHLVRLTTWLANGIRERSLRFGIPVQVNQAASLLTIFFTEHVVTDWESAKTADTQRFGQFFHHMLGQGVYLPPAQFEAAFLSTAHTPKDIEKVLQAVDKAFEKITSVWEKKRPAVPAPSRSKDVSPRRVPTAL
ncbi:MAG: glutamate-1-semialdehyde 2,1-aminomutase [Elusimicrobia bacterium]|nr:glutamate-1-semialdehyde 2,1-aminomutase [Elusimicrobiota bacterium]